MSLNSLIISSLQSTRVPVAFQHYPGNEDTYITFFEFAQNGALYGDDQELKSDHAIQVDIWSKSDYTYLTKQVKDILKNIGFTKSYETELYETDTEIYHKVLRFNFVQ